MKRSSMRSARSMLLSQGHLLRDAFGPAKRIADFGKDLRARSGERFNPTVAV